jgi:peptidoglycan lytic transglycosylase G
VLTHYGLNAKDAAWHDCGDEVVGSDFPPPGGNGKDPQWSGPTGAPVQGRPASRPLAGESYPQQSIRATNGAASKESKRIAPRSPRTALEPEQVLMPTRISRGARNPFVRAGSALFTLVLVLGLIGGVGYIVGKQRFEMSGPLSDEKVVVIPRSAGIRDIADLLEREGVIDQPWLFIGGVVVMKAREDLKFGEYQFAAHSSLREVVDIITQGKVVQHVFKIPEGLTSEQIIARLSDNDVLTGNIRDIPREGTLLPETYKFTRGMTREQMIQRMQQQQRRLVQEIWDRRMPDLPIRTVEQLIILASIVEKETGKPEERTRVAAVFVNRLKQRMKLQSDPTIIYGLVGGKGTLGRPIMRSEIEQLTPYNTYVIEGLPPGPIANPGRASLEAAANPARTRELFFVADGTGGHAFADNYEQHQKNVARLRQIEQQGNAAAPAPARASAPAPPRTPIALPPLPKQAPQ